MWASIPSSEVSSALNEDVPKSQESGHSLDGESSIAFAVFNFTNSIVGKHGKYNRLINMKIIYCEH